MEIQQLKAKNHGLNTQMDALAADHERLAGLLDIAEKVRLCTRMCVTQGSSGYLSHGREGVSHVNACNSGYLRVSMT